MARIGDGSQVPSPVEVREHSAPTGHTCEVWLPGRWRVIKVQGGESREPPGKKATLENVGIDAGGCSRRFWGGKCRSARPQSQIILPLLWRILNFIVTVLHVQANGGSPSSLSLPRDASHSAESKRFKRNSDDSDERVWESSVGFLLFLASHWNQWCVK